MTSSCVRSGTPSPTTAPWGVSLLTDGILDAGRGDKSATQPALLELAGGAIEYEELPAKAGAEDLAPLVFLHEGLGSRQLWRGFPAAAVAAASGRRALIFSRHGYGRSAVVSAPRGVDYKLEGRDGPA
jgi:pimeloyl-ACP methyl ester carboxylesterase